MIEIYDGWSISVESLSYNVVKHGKGKSKDGEVIDTTKTYGYYGSLEAALEGLRREMIREELSEKDMTLAQAITAIGESNGRLRRAIEGAFPKGIKA